MSVMSEIDAPSPPNAWGIWEPSSFCARAASMAACGKRAWRSTSVASAAATAATLAVRGRNEALSTKDGGFDMLVVSRDLACTFMADITSGVLSVRNVCAKCHAAFRIDRATAFDRAMWHKDLIQIRR